MTTTHPANRIPSSPTIKVFLLTDSDVLAQDGGSSLWRSVASAGRGMRRRQRLRSLRDLKRMTPPTRAGSRRAEGKPKAPREAHAAATRRMEIYDPLTSFVVACPGGPGAPRSGRFVCCILPDGRFLIGARRRQAAPPTTPARIAGPPPPCVPPALAPPAAAAARPRSSQSG